VARVPHEHQRPRNDDHAGSPDGLRMQLVDLILGLIFCLYERGIKILHLHGFIQTVQVSVPPQ
jgi:hypothetical protein